MVSYYSVINFLLLVDRQLINVNAPTDPESSTMKGRTNSRFV